jgi:hypothetical protein
MAELTQSTEEARARRGSGLLALARARLRRSGGGRAASVFRILLFVGFAGAILVVRATDGGDAPLTGFIGAAARWVAWLVGAPLALAAAQDHHALDQRDGIAPLAAIRGFPPRSLEAARVLGAMLEITLALGVPLVALAGLTAAVAGSPALAFVRIGLGFAAAAFAIVAGVTLGGISAACGQLGRARGRLLLFAVVVGPWILADVTGYRSFSIPGALAAALDFALGGAGA